MRRPILACLLLAMSWPFAAPAADDAPDMPAHETFDMDSRILGETRRINVYLPPACSGPAGAEGKTPRYETLYVPDGGIGEDFPHVARDVDAAIRAGEMQPTILVGIENTQRRRDMTGPTSVAGDREIAPVVGGSAGFRAFIRDELVPRIERSYPTAGPRAIIGESLAGLFVLESLLLSPDLFDTWISLSPSLWWNDEALVRTAGAGLARMPPRKRRLLVVTAGDDGLGQAASALEQALRAHAPEDFAWTVRPRPDLRHDNIYALASPGILRELFPPAPGNATRCPGD